TTRPTRACSPPTSFSPLCASGRPPRYACAVASDRQIGSADAGRAVDPSPARWNGRENGKRPGLMSTRRKRQATPADGALIRAVALKRPEIPDFDKYPFSIPAVRQLDELAFDPRVTFFIGENGSGKSTLVEAIAVAAGFSPEGGSRH